MYGDPLFAPGGKAVPYAASVRIELKQRGKAKEGADVIDLDKGEDGVGDGDVMGVHTRAKVIKNRLGPPHRSCKFFISFESGIQDKSSWFQVFRERGLFEKGDGWIKVPSYKKDFKFRSKGWLDVLKTDKDFGTWVKAKLEELMVVKYGEKAHGSDVDPESLLEVEQLQRDLIEPQ
jgi:recombination protein RecA